MPRIINQAHEGHSLARLKLGGIVLHEKNFAGAAFSTALYWLAATLYQVICVLAQYVCVGAVQCLRVGPVMTALARK